MKKIILSIVAVLLGLMGMVWFLQGIGVIGGSFMSNTVTWTIIGPIVVILAVALFWYGNRSKSL